MTRGGRCPGCGHGKPGGPYCTHPFHGRGSPSRESGALLASLDKLYLGTLSDADAQKARDDIRSALSTLERDAARMRGHSVLEEIAEERARQDAQWGGPDHDDTHSHADWYRYRQRFELERDPARMRSACVKIAALAVAEIESLDRAALTPSGEPTTTPETSK